MGNDHDGRVPFRFEVIKKYPQRGPLHQYRLAAATTFTCRRCGKDKTSKLAVAIHDKWDLLLCNACYGRLLSIWEIKAGDLGDSERHAELMRLLQGLAREAEVEQARSALIARDSRFALLSSSALTMLATAEAVADGFALKMATELDWSAAIIGLCKAVELETGRLIGEPLRDAASGRDLAIDLADRDFSRMARFCKGGNPIELGAFAHFVEAVARSPRSANSPLASILRSLILRWPRSDWLFAADGFAPRVRTLTRQYRNPAAHTTLLTEAEYRSCAEAVQGADGILWKLLAAVEPTRR
ncbi:hypothetical protein [Streptomyces sp. AK02-01A]|uniref:hypothetical protein n=1 Tax=Streptomyces sp. AK02-01A TaxID=3028648 RepID=UPI0029AC5B6D|nr:hypothetical protein [Streptomyces sp. AK02-01A]MDX3849188.1 hypothetical protein [Streptomyces sp. AK02-01A]